jgi:hypothetical protein
MHEEILYMEDNVNEIVDTSQIINELVHNVDNQVQNDIKYKSKLKIHLMKRRMK